MMKRAWPVLLLILTLLVSGCGFAGDSGGKLRVTATTGMLADLAARVGGERVAVTALMGPGVDPHLYKPSQGDISRMGNAQIIFANGLHLEGRMGEILTRMSAGRPTIAVAERIPAELLLRTEEGEVDPHIWFDVSLWLRALDVVRDALIAVDPAGRATYEANADQYRQELADLHRWAKESLAAVPAEQRVLVTAHDAFGYFGRAYGVEVMGLQGISTAAEYGLTDLQRLVDLLVSRRIKAVFVESSLPQRSVQALVEGARARGHQVTIGGELYSDAMGPAGSPAGTYIGMIRHNVETIVAALK